MCFTKLYLFVNVFTSIYFHTYAYELNDVSFSREWSVRTDPTGDQVSIITVHNHLVYKWLSCDPDFTLILKSLEIGFPPCRVPIVLHYRSLRDLATIGLGNGKLLFWLEDHNTEKSCWRHYFVDLLSCLYDGYLIEGSGKILATVAYRDQFDALIANGTVCASNATACVVRYNDKGISLKNFTIPYGENSTRHRLVSIKENDPNSGFFYVEEMNDGRSVVRLLDWNFSEEKSQEYNHTIDAVSLSHEGINICYLKVDEKRISCKFMNSQLDSKGNVTVDSADEINGIEMFNLSDGGAILLTISSSNETFIVNARYMNVEGVGKPVELEKYTCNDKLKVQHSELRDNVHCVTTLCKDSDIIRTKCITPENERGMIVMHDKTL